MAGDAENSGGEQPKRKKPRGRPFPKGVSGNPGGRPKEAKQLREVLALKGEEFVRALEKQALEGNTPALLRVVEYLLGKPAQDLHVSGADGGPLEVIIRTEVAEGDS